MGNIACLGFMKVSNNNNNETDTMISETKSDESYSENLFI